MNHTINSMNEPIEKAVRTLATPPRFGKHACVYTILNSVTGERYVGSTANLRRRATNHRSLLRRGIHDNRLLQQAKVGPIDARPAPGGNVTIDLTDDTYCVWGPAERREMDPSTLHRNHFATCGQAAHWHRHGSRNDTTVMEVPHAHA